MRKTETPVEMRGVQLHLPPGLMEGAEGRAGDGHESYSLQEALSSSDALVKGAPRKGVPPPRIRGAPEKVRSDLFPRVEGQGGASHQLISPEPCFLFHQSLRLKRES